MTENQSLAYSPDGIWQAIERKTRALDASGIRLDIDYGKFAVYSIVTHSTAIEGSTLTELETEVLFDSGLTAKGKPLVHHLMNTDLKDAYLFAVKRAEEALVFSPDFLKTLNAMVMKSTGGINSVIGGDFDSSRGDFRLCGVSAGIGGKSYLNYQKISGKIDALCKDLNGKLSAARVNPQTPGLRGLYEISFNAHLDLATIHPWVDGNGRTARLLMNCLQFNLKLIPTKTFSEDRTEYIASLRESQDTGDNSRFLEFMASQHLKTLEEAAAGARFIAPLPTPRKP